MELTSDYKLMYDKSEREPDTIRQIIKLHTLDILYGNNREQLNYVDALYPSIEGLFGIDICTASLGDKNALRTFYEGNFNTEISYDELRNFFDEAKKTCNKIQNEETYLSASKKVVEEVSKVCEKIANKKM